MRTVTVGLSLFALTACTTLTDLVRPGGTVTINPDLKRAIVVGCPYAKIVEAAAPLVMSKLKPGTTLDQAKQGVALVSSELDTLCAALCILPPSNGVQNSSFVSGTGTVCASGTTTDSQSAPR